MNTFTSDKHSEISDLSIQTDIKVFKGGLGLLNNNLYGNNSCTNINSINYETGTKSIGIADKKIASKNENNIRNVNNYEDILSFRSKKESQVFLDMNNTNISNDQSIDSTVITKQIIDKIGTMKVPYKKKILLLKSEDEAINKIFIKSEIQKVEDEKEIKNFETEPALDVFDNNNLEICIGEEENEETNQKIHIEKLIEEKNIFWNLKTNINENNLIEKNRSRSVIHQRVPGQFLKAQDLQNQEKNNRKEIYLSSITCTLSRIEKGRAIFVSTDDFIFVLPALFVPRNLIVGNTYNFRISEYEKFRNKTANIGEIQKKYINNFTKISN